MTEAPVGMWLCPKCCPNVEFYLKQLGKKRAATPAVSRQKVEKRAGASGSKREEKEQESRVEKTKREAAMKGPAVKKPVRSKPEPKPKPRWVGWQEMSTDGEKKFKKSVDAQWEVEDVGDRKRKTVSKIMFEEDEAGPSRLSSRTKARGKRRVVVTSSDEEDEEECTIQRRPEETDFEASIYQEKEEEEEEEDNTDDNHNDDDDKDEDAKKQYDDDDEDEMEEQDLSDPSDLSDDTMDRDDVPPGSKDGSPSKLPTRDFEEKRQLARQLGQFDQDDEDGASKRDLEDLDDPMETDSHHETRSSDLSDNESQYINEDEVDTPTPPRTPLKIPRGGREVPDSVSPSPGPTEAASRAVSLVLEVSHLADERDDGMDVDARDEAQTPVAFLYQRQGNCWGDFPKSAIRSTLPRLA